MKSQITPGTRAHLPNCEQCDPNSNLLNFLLATDSANNSIFERVSRRYLVSVDSVMSSEIIAETTHMLECMLDPVLPEPSLPGTICCLEFVVIRNVSGAEFSFLFLQDESRAQPRVGENRNADIRADFSVAAQISLESDECDSFLF